ncbi:hypothetical protein F2Q69_00011881 [Brassica cretica]|uniref:Glycosyltransferase n=1 Tax=Brassica cretica TaxID=69181 RepID=A0A8S9R9J9_BRACR|nr:hypothetical protein F2Q69_00011881 [Brassica cretica]
MDPIIPQPFGVCHVVAMPWPGRGHINPMMNFCKRLLRDPTLIVTFVVTEEWLGFIGFDPKPNRIHFATLPNLIPSELVRANNFTGFIDAIYTNLEEPFEHLLDSLSFPPPTVIISDTFVLWAVSVGTRRNIPVASFWTESAAILSLFVHSDLLQLTAIFRPNHQTKEDEVVDYIPGLSPTRLRDLPEIYHGFSHQVFNKFKPCFDELSKAKYLLFPSAYELEPKAVDFFTSKFDFPPPGSFLSVTEAEMKEIVGGVRETGVRFLWVARGGELKLKEALEGSSGVVVSWCDQLRVLSHAAVGGFWTHCGFNSTLEGIYSGVPMLTFPLFWDQFLNAKMIVEDWRVGMRIKSDKKTELVRRDEIKELVKRFMDGESEEGREMRRRACDLSEICRGSVVKAGSSDVNIDAFLKDITKIV